MSCWTRAAGRLALLVPLSAGQTWSYVNFFRGPAFIADADGVITGLADSPVADTYVSSSMKVPLTKRMNFNVIIEWGNVLDKDRTFAEWKQEANLPRTINVYAVENAQVTVTDMFSGVVLATESILAGNVGTLYYTAQQGSDITSDGDILVHLRYDSEANKYNTPLLRPAAVIFGACSGKCTVATPGAAAATIHRVCSDGTTGDFEANAYFEGATAYAVPVCRYEVPPGGPLIVGHAYHDGSGGEAVAFVSSDQFQMHFAIPLDNDLVLVYGDQPADCSWQAPGGSETQFQLQGFTESPGSPGVYFSQISSVPAGTVFCCSVPVAALADVACGPSSFCSWKETNILAMSDPLAACAASSSSSSSSSSTTATLTSTISTSSTSSGSTTTSTSTTSTSSTRSTGTTTSTSTTSTSSTSSRSTTTATLTTSTTTTLAVPPPAADLLMQLAAKWEETELERLQASNNDSVSYSDFNITTMAARVFRVDAGIPVPVGGVAGGVAVWMEVSLPEALFAKFQLEVALLTATSFGPEYHDRLAWPHEGQNVLAEDAPEIGGQRLISITVFAVVHVNVAAHTIANLTEPINITLNIGRTPELECAYWDYTSGLWRNDGVWMVDVPMGSPVVCQTTHLSLFAAIARGYLQAFACSQLKLLKRESILELGNVEWVMTPGAQAMWGVLAFFLVLLILGAVQDCRRARVWSDKDFLVIMAEAAEEEEEANGEPDKGASRWVCCCFTLCGAFLAWCKESSALRDVIDEIASKYFSYFSELRDFIEGLIDGLPCSAEGGGGGLTIAVHRMMTSVVVSSASRQAAAAEGISSDLATFCFEDEDLHHVLVQGHMVRGRPAGSPRLPKSPQNPSVTSSDCAGVWSTQVDRLVSQTHHFTEAASQCWSLPCAVLRLTWWQHPIGACLVRCIFLSSKIRVLLFLVDITGAVMLSTFFYSSTGTVPSKRNRSASCNFSELGDMIGRLLAIATVSVIISSIPAMFLGSLCTRGIKRLDAEDSGDWERQLRVWRIQDRIIYVSGTLYVLFCVFFTSLFLANTSVQDQRGWLFGIALSLLEDLVVIPLVVAVTMPLLAAFLLQILSCCRSEKKRELVGNVKLEASNKPNVTLEVQKI